MARVTDIRPATESDLSAIREMAHLTWPHTFGKILSPAQITYMLERMYSLHSLKEQVATGHRFLIACREGENIGYASFELQYKGLPKTRIHKIYVLPQDQGSGAGKALMDAIERTGRAHHHECLNLNVNRENGAVRFYQRIGFQIVGTGDIPIGNGYLMEDYVMEKRLA